MIEDHLGPQEGDLDDDLLDSALQAGHEFSLRPLSGAALQQAGDSAFDFPAVHLRAAQHAGTECAETSVAEGANALDGRYEIRGEIGEGGVGRVHLARDTELGRDIAIKILHEKHLHNTSIVDRFVEEAQICAQLNHPAIVPIHEIGLWGERAPFISMKLVSGETLAELLAQRESPDQDSRRFLTIFEQVCQAVAYAHTRGVVHRDLKPANVMVGRFGEVHVMDWGMAKVLDRPESTREESEAPVATIRSRKDSSGSVSGSVMGTLAYLSPEQARGDVDEIDERTDVFGLGGMLCEILTGLPPYVGADARTLRRLARAADLSGALVRLDHCGAEPELVELARRCLRPERAARLRTAAVLADKVAAYLSAVEQRAEEAHVAAALADEKATSAKRAQRLTLVIAGALLLALLFAGGFFWVQRGQERQRARLESEILIAVADVRRLMEVAQARPVDETEGWDRARESLKTVGHLVLTGEVDDALRARVDVLEAKLNSAWDLAQIAARAKQRDLDMVRRLEEVAVEIEDGQAIQWIELNTVRLDHSETDSASEEFYRRGGAWVEAWTLRPVFDPIPYGRSVEYDSTGYRAAFAAYGPELGVGNGSVESAAVAIGRTEIAIEMAAGLDAWAAIERHIDGRSSDRARRLQRIAMAADPDPWRREVRELLLAEPFDRDALAERVRTVNPDELSETDVALVARELWVDGRSTPEAIELLDKFLGRHRDSFVIAVQLALAHTHAVEINWHEALRAWTTASTARTQSAGALLGCARARLSLGDFDKALELCLIVQRDHSDNAIGYYQAAAVEVARGALDAAAGQYKQAIEQEPRAVFHDNLAAVYVAQGKPDLAVVEYEAAMDLLERDWAPLLIRYALALGEQLDWSKSIPALERALEVEEPENRYIVYSNLGDHLRRNADFQRAIEACERAIDLRPDFVDAHYNLAFVHKDMHNYPLAIKSFRVALDISPDANIYSELGVALMNNGEPREAVAAFEEAILLQPEWFVLHMNMVRPCLESGDFDRAVQAGEKAVELNGDAGDARFNLAEAYRQAGQEERAIEEYNEVILGDPEWARPRNNLGRLLLSRDDLVGALHHLTEAVKYDPSIGFAWYNLGRLYLRQGQYDEALSHVSKGYKLAGGEDPSLPEALLREFAAKGDRLESILDQPGVTQDASELLLAGQLGYRIHRYAASAGAWRAAFRANPGCAEDFGALYRYSAVCSALLAAAGRGEDAQVLTETARADLRGEALEWLWADFHHYLGEIEEGSGQPATNQLGWWTQDPDLAGVRGDEIERSLPDAEQEDWRAFWVEVHALLEPQDDGG